MTSTQHTGATMPLVDAEDMLAEVRNIMAEQQLDYGPAVNEYIRRRQPAVQSLAEAILRHRSRNDQPVTGRSYGLDSVGG